MSVLSDKVLVATDGSVESARAARMAVGLSQSLGSELHVVHVAPVPDTFAVPESTIRDPEFGERVIEIAERDARTKLDEEVEKVEGIGGEVAGTHARVGRPDAEIVSFAEELGAGLVVLGSRGLGTLRRAVMGSVSDSVVRHAHGSVLVVRGNERERDYLPGRILLALDGSKEADAAARAATEIAVATGSELHVLYALPTQERLPYPHPYATERWEAILEQTKHDAREFVDEQAERIEAERGRVKDAHLAFGRPEGEIVRLGEELDAGLIVTGNRGLGGVRRALMGSVSGSVVRHAHCPVLVVREEDPVAGAGEG